MKIESSCLRSDWLIVLFIMITLVWGFDIVFFSILFLFSYVVGGPDVAPATERLGYGRESIEDDPFIVAASIQSLNSIDRKKEKPAPSVNYGYLSEGKLVIL